MRNEEVVELDGRTLDRHKIERVVYGDVKAIVPEADLIRVRASRERIEKQLRDGKVIYGVNTGFGKLSDIKIEKEDIEKIQLNLLRADAVGVGDPLPTPVVRAMMVLRANALKESSLAAIVATPELMYYGRALASQYYRVWEPYLTAALIYLVLTTTLSFLLNHLERRLATE